MTLQSQASGDGNTMSEIPADIIAAADKALDNMLCHSRESSGSSEAYRKDCVYEIAKAIEAERERCAKLCAETSMGTPYGGSKPTHGRYLADPAVDEFHVGTGYAALIRHGLRPPTPEET